jgi:aldose 1-epimerase
LELWTDAAGFQLYTGNWLDGSLSGKKSQSGAPYGQYSGFCLEASAPPNAAGMRDWRPSVLLKKGEISTRQDVYHLYVV